VGILTSEAKVLAQATGRKFKAPGVAVSRVLGMVRASQGNMDMPDDSRHMGVPCPFLEGGCCSVYDHRPVACRLHLNLDSDSLLCEVVPGVPATVPYVNKLEVLAACMDVMPGNDRLADIREFFG
jgi:Fe-S-cluster containining protein